MQPPYCRCSDRSVNNDDPMYMIWHDHECIQIDKREMYRYFIPHLRCNTPDFRQMHLTVDHITKPFLLPCCADCNKIFSGPEVIPAYNVMNYTGNCSCTVSTYKTKQQFYTRYETSLTFSGFRKGLTP